MIPLTNRAKQLGPSLKAVICIFVLPVLLTLWPILGIFGSIVGGGAYGLLQPIFSTIQGVDEGKENKLRHCLTVCFILMSLKCLLFLLILLSFVIEIAYYFSGWYTEHSRKELHGCSGLKRCLLCFLLFCYGWPAKQRTSG